METPVAGAGGSVTRLQPVFGLFVAGLLCGGPVHAAADADDSCPELAAYKARSHATEKGARRRCSLLMEIQRGGRPVPHHLRERMLDELDNRFAIDLEFNGDVELPGRAIDYLLENMPETAALVTAYTSKEYRATQIDSTPGPAGFFVTNGKSFAANFTYLVSRNSPSISEHMFFENGNAKVLFWKIWGSSFIRYKLQKGGEESARYAIRVHVFTDSRLLRTVLGSGLFRYFADRMFKGILQDIESAVRQFAVDSNPHQHLPPYFVMGLKGKLATNRAPRQAR